MCDIVVLLYPDPAIGSHRFSNTGVGWSTHLMMYGLYARELCASRRDLLDVDRNCSGIQPGGGVNSGYGNRAVRSDLQESDRDRDRRSGLAAEQKLGNAA